jgi:Zn-dependent protease
LNLSPEQLVLDAVMIAIFLGIAFPVHECAHALVAYLRGDATAKLYGRISLNPVVHFDPVGGLMTVISIFLGGFLIGWAKPTPVNPNNLRDRRNDEVLVALAGPGSNLLMAVIGGIVVRVLVALNATPPDLVLQALFYFVVFNVMLAIFNLIPIPPLDGANLLFRFLPLRITWQVRPFLAQYGIFIILGFVLLASRLLSGLIYGVAFALMGVG